MPDRSRIFFLFSGDQNELPKLLKNYKDCAETGTKDEAKKIIRDITLIFENEGNTTGKELWEHACELRKAEQYLESVALFRASASLFKNESDGETTLDSMKWCVWEMLVANRGMIKTDERLKQVVKDHVIPLMHDIKVDMERVTSVDEETKCEKVVQVLWWIGVNESEIGELRSEVETNKEGLARELKTFGNNAEKREIYGLMLVGLGDLHRKMHQTDDATSCYQQALDVFRNAPGIDADWRQTWIKSCKKKIKSVRRSNNPCKTM